LGELVKSQAQRLNSVMAETEKPAKQAKTGSREKRLAAALRENLRRRKAQEKARAAAGPGDGSGPSRVKENR
jgi:hypothetical protein